MSGLVKSDILVKTATNKREANVERKPRIPVSKEKTVSSRSQKENKSGTVKRQPVTKTKDVKSVSEKSSKLSKSQNVSGQSNAKGGEPKSPLSVRKEKREVEISGCDKTERNPFIDREARVDDEMARNEGKEKMDTSRDSTSAITDSTLALSTVSIKSDTSSKTSSVSSKTSTATSGSSMSSVIKTNKSKDRSNMSKPDRIPDASKCLPNDKADIKTKQRVSTDSANEKTRKSVTSKTEIKTVKSSATVTKVTNRAQRSRSSTPMSLSSSSDETKVSKTSKREVHENKSATSSKLSQKKSSSQISANSKPSQKISETTESKSERSRSLTPGSVSSDGSRSNKSSTSSSNSRQATKTTSVSDIKSKVQISKKLVNKNKLPVAEKSKPVGTVERCSENKPKSEIKSYMKPTQSIARKSGVKPSTSKEIVSADLKIRSSGSRSNTSVSMTSSVKSDTSESSTKVSKKMQTRSSLKIESRSDTPVSMTSSVHSDVSETNIETGKTRSGAAFSREKAPAKSNMKLRSRSNTPVSMTSSIRSDISDTNSEKGKVRSSGKLSRESTCDSITRHVPPQKKKGIPAATVNKRSSVTATTSVTKSSKSSIPLAGKKSEDKLKRVSLDKVASSSQKTSGNKVPVSENLVSDVSSVQSKKNITKTQTVMKNVESTEESKSIAESSNEEILPSKTSVNKNDTPEDSKSQYLLASGGSKKPERKSKLIAPVAQDVTNRLSKLSKPTHRPAPTTSGKSTQLKPKHSVTKQSDSKLSLQKTTVKSTSVKTIELIQSSSTNIPGKISGGKHSTANGSICSTAAVNNGKMQNRGQGINPSKTVYKTVSKKQENASLEMNKCQSEYRSVKNTDLASSLSDWNSGTGTDRLGENGDVCVSMGTGFAFSADSMSGALIDRGAEGSDPVYGEISSDLRLEENFAYDDVDSGIPLEEGGDAQTCVRSDLELRQSAELKYSDGNHSDLKSRASSAVLQKSAAEAKIKSTGDVSRSVCDVKPRTLAENVHVKISKNDSCLSKTKEIPAQNISFKHEQRVTVDIKQFNDECQIDKHASSLKSDNSAGRKYTSCLYENEIEIIDPKNSISNYTEPAMCQNDDKQERCSDMMVNELQGLKSSCLRNMPDEDGRVVLGRDTVFDKFRNVSPHISGAECSQFDSERHRNKDASQPSIILYADRNSMTDKQRLGSTTVKRHVPKDRHGRQQFSSIADTDGSSKASHENDVSGLPQNEQLDGNIRIYSDHIKSEEISDCGTSSAKEQVLSDWQRGRGFDKIESENKEGKQQEAQHGTASERNKGVVRHISSAERQGSAGYSNGLKNYSKSVDLFKTEMDDSDVSFPCSNCDMANDGGLVKGVLDKENKDGYVEICENDIETHLVKSDQLNSSENCETTHLHMDNTVRIAQTGHESVSRDNVFSEELSCGTSHSDGLSVQDSRACDSNSQGRELRRSSVQESRVLVESSNNQVTGEITTETPVSIPSLLNDDGPENEHVDTNQNIKSDVSECPIFGDKLHLYEAELCEIGSCTERNVYNTHLSEKSLSDTFNDFTKQSGCDILTIPEINYHQVGCVLVEQDLNEFMCLKNESSVSSCSINIKTTHLLPDSKQKVTHTPASYHRDKVPDTDAGMKSDPIRDKENVSLQNIDSVEHSDGTDFNIENAVSLLKKEIQVSDENDQSAMPLVKNTDDVSIQCIDNNDQREMIAGNSVLVENDYGHVRTCHDAGAQQDVRLPCPGDEGSSREPSTHNPLVNQNMFKDKAAPLSTVKIKTTQQSSCNQEVLGNSSQPNEFMLRDIVREKSVGYENHLTSVDQPDTHKNTSSNFEFVDNKLDVSRRSSSLHADKNCYSLQDKNVSCLPTDLQVESDKNSTFCGKDCLYHNQINEPFIKTEGICPCWQNNRIKEIKHRDKCTLTQPETSLSDQQLREIERSDSDNKFSGKEADVFIKDNSITGGSGQGRILHSVDGSLICEQHPCGKERSQFHLTDYSCNEVVNLSSRNDKSLVTQGDNRSRAGVPNLQSAKLSDPLVQDVDFDCKADTDRKKFVKKNSSLSKSQTEGLSFAEIYSNKGLIESKSEASCISRIHELNSLERQEARVITHAGEALCDNILISDVPEIFDDGYEHFVDAEDTFDSDLVREQRHSQTSSTKDNQSDTGSLYNVGDVSTSIESFQDAVEELNDDTLLNVISKQREVCTDHEEHLSQISLPSSDVSENDDTSLESLAGLDDISDNITDTEENNEEMERQRNEILKTSSISKVSRHLRVAEYRTAVFKDKAFSGNHATSSVFKDRHTAIKADVLRSDETGYEKGQQVIKNVIFKTGNSLPPDESNSQSESGKSSTVVYVDVKDPSCHDNGERKQGEGNWQTFRENSELSSSENVNFKESKESRYNYQHHVTQIDQAVTVQGQREQHTSKNGPQFATSVTVSKEFPAVLHQSKRSTVNSKIETALSIRTERRRRRQIDIQQKTENTSTTSDAPVLKNDNESIQTIYSSHKSQNNDGIYESSKTTTASNVLISSDSHTLTSENEMVYANINNLEGNAGHAQTGICKETCVLEGTIVNFMTQPQRASTFKLTKTEDVNDKVDINDAENRDNIRNEPFSSVSVQRTCGGIMLEIGVMGNDSKTTFTTHSSKLEETPKPAEELDDIQFIDDEDESGGVSNYSEDVDKQTNERTPSPNASFTVMYEVSSEEDVTVLNETESSASLCDKNPTDTDIEIRDVDTESNKGQHISEIISISNDTCESEDQITDRDVIETTGTTLDSSVTNACEDISVTDICEESNISVAMALQMEKQKLLEKSDDDISLESHERRFLQKRSITADNCTLKYFEKLEENEAGVESLHADISSIRKNIRKSSSFRIDRDGTYPDKDKDTKETAALMNKRVSDICRSFLNKTRTQARTEKDKEVIKSPTPQRKLMKWVNANGKWMRIPINEKTPPDDNIRELNDNIPAIAEPHLPVSLTDQPQDLCDKKNEESLLVQNEDNTKSIEGDIYVDVKQDEINLAQPADSDTLEVDKSMSSDLPTASEDSANSLIPESNTTDVSDIALEHNQANLNPEEENISQSEIVSDISETDTVQMDSSAKSHTVEEESSAEHNCRYIDKSSLKIDTEANVIPESTLNKVINVTKERDYIETRPQTEDVSNSNVISLNESSENAEHIRDSVENRFDTEIVGKQVEEKSSIEESPEMELKPEDFLLSFRECHGRKKPKGILHIRSNIKSGDKSLTSESNRDSVELEIPKQIPKLKAVKIQEEIFEGRPEYMKECNRIPLVTESDDSKPEASNVEQSSKTSEDSDSELEICTLTKVTLKKSKTFSGFKDNSTMKPSLSEQIRSISNTSLNKEDSRDIDANINVAAEKTSKNLFRSRSRSVESVRRLQDDYEQKSKQRSFKNLYLKGGIPGFRKKSSEKKKSDHGKQAEGIQERQEGTSAAEEMCKPDKRRLKLPLFSRSDRSKTLPRNKLLSEIVEVEENKDDIAHPISDQQQTATLGRQSRRSKPAEQRSNKRRSLSLPTGSLAFGEARIVYKNGHFTIETMDGTEVDSSRPPDPRVSRNTLNEMYVNTESSGVMKDHFSGEVNMGKGDGRELTHINRTHAMKRQYGKIALTKGESADSEDVFHNDENNIENISPNSRTNSRTLRSGQSQHDSYTESCSNSSRMSDMSLGSSYSEIMDIDDADDVRETSDRLISDSSVPEDGEGEVKRVAQRARRTSSFRQAQEAGLALDRVSEDSDQSGSRGRSGSLDECSTQDPTKQAQNKSTILQKMIPKRKTLNENLNMTSFSRQSESAKEFFAKKMTLKGLFKKTKSETAIGSPIKTMHPVSPPIAAFQGDDDIGSVDTPPGSPFTSQGTHEFRRRHTSADICVRRGLNDSNDVDSNSATPTQEKTVSFLHRSVSSPSTPSLETNSIISASSSSALSVPEDDQMSINSACSGTSSVQSVQSPAPSEQPHKPKTPKPVGASPRRNPSIGSSHSRSHSAQRTKSVTSLESDHSGENMNDDVLQDCRCECAHRLHQGQGHNLDSNNQGSAGSSESLTMCQYCKRLSDIRSSGGILISNVERLRKHSLSNKQHSAEDSSSAKYRDSEDRTKGRKDSTKASYERLTIVGQTDVMSNNSNDSGIQRDASIQSSSESVKAVPESQVKFRRRKSTSPQPERPKSEVGVRWADLDTDDLDMAMATPVRMRHRDQSSRDRPRPKSDFEGSSFLSDRMRAFGSEVNLQPYCSLRNLYEMRRRDMDKQKNRRMSTPHPIKTRNQRVPRKLQKQPPLVRSSSMPESLDKIHKRRKLHHLLDFHMDSLSRHVSDYDDISDDSDLSFDHASLQEKSVSIRSSNSQLTAMDEEEDNLTYAEALWDHITMDPEELGFRAQDLIEVLDMSDKDWWFGVIEDREGWFPATFVRLRVNQDQLEEEEEEELEVALHESLSTSPKMRRISMFNKNQARTNVVNEIISAEREYVKHLKDVVEGYIVHARKRKEMFPQERIELIFGNLEIIYEFAQQFLVQLEECMDVCPHLSEIGQCFLDNERGFEIYSDYCNNHPSACEELKELCMDSKYKHFFEACRLLQELVEIPLEGFLLTPVQKICKYPLQLAELLKYTPPDHPDYTLVRDALAAMRKIATLINERKRKMESIEKIAAWQHSVVDWEGEDLLACSSELIFSGEVNKINTAGWSQERYFFLFDHQLIYCKKELLKRHVFSYKGRIDLDHCEIEDIPDGKDSQYNVTVKNAWKLHETQKNKWYLLYAKTEALKKKWLKALADERRRVKEDKENDFAVPDHWKQTVLNKVRSQSSLKDKNVSRGSHGTNYHKDFTYATLPRRVHGQKQDKKKGWFIFGGGKKSKR